jgi:Uma2 family endonuclease
MLMTPEEFDAIPEDRWVRGNRYELIRGVLIVSPPVNNEEADPNDYLGFLLRLYQETHPKGRVIDATMPERGVPGTPNRRRCDRAIWVGLGRIPDTEVDVPAIVVEFVSGGRRDVVRDYEEKRDEYLAAGVIEYWIIDRFRRMMTVYRAGVCGPSVEHVLEAGTYRTGLMPGFELPLARLLARADAWKKPKPKRRVKPPTTAVSEIETDPTPPPATDPSPPAPTNPPTGGEE